MAPMMPNARPRSGPWKSSWIRPVFCGVSRPPATPCSSRATTSSPALGAAPLSALVTTNAQSAMTYIRRRPIASPSRPAGTSTSPRVSEYPDTTHCTVAGDASRPRWIDGSATFTMLTSSSAMNAAN
jgi:hypothetical protein